ncbi:LLM class flavin-dependent oxidoreductase [Geodermatophilus ruber]|uniref:Flavin-dependent oxidoreductase, luciferase family (Includes alkanesulfonate monooxygenase SsuD and methylene tetrahydromethanopterin reductase) n=1 Tax=Geodermatophilus ruber TaxID=504800 RepID=A0A1I4I5C8_9ACTN|nr:LLM class flavin-dependent oxidoreductase [Geodermatophilus ruber]SFL49642.1 Flavin-dependent oxidoreductase, luciferase family (includes alkanesulfonate monooxygenase SsuD and methylene tetrahydromethanopterin reductase) [Geodermatophilus ruber]
MQIGLFHSIQWPEGSDQRERYEQATAQACAADDLGFDSIWLTEHHFSRHGIVSDSLAVLAHLAARTGSVRLGTAVTVLPLHHPLRVAEAAATVDQLSGGRLDLGIGRGYQPGEFRGFGVDIAEKHDRFTEALDVLRRVWTADGPVSHTGTYWSFEDAAPQPRPVQRPHPPLWVATDSPDGLAICAAEGYGVLLPQGTSLTVTAAQMKRYGEALAGAGLGPAGGRAYLARAAHVAATDEQAWAEAEGPYKDFLGYADRLRRARSGSDPGGRSPFDLDTDLRDSALFGSPETVISRLRDIRELGIERVMLFVHLGGLPHERIMSSLDLLAREVLPVVREL